ncbi:MAG: anhydro-N-acetylmuramic acid kinase [Candidatus Hydrogenedentota bacterium]
MNLEKLQKKDARYGIGLMSGTSCDGVDAALVRIKGTGPELVMKLIAFESFPFSTDLTLRLLASRHDAKELCALNFELGEQMAKAAASMIKVARAEPVDVDFIASSGHTVAHLPPRNHEGSGTLQIGETAIIAEKCKLPVISNFRPRDMAAGGQGAPLVPYADWVLFHRDDRTAAFLNIGGIANITVVPPKLEDVLAFDTGPGNMIIDGAMRLITVGAKSMDEDGALAAQGVVIDEFLEYLLEHPYFRELPPKSTGREEFGPDVYLRDALASRRDRRAEDIMATVTAAVAYSINRAFNRFVKPQYNISRFVISGGGAHNKTLTKLISQGLKGITVRRSDHYNMPVDAREAIAFAILGNETICGTPSNVPSATGANRKVVLGQITPG